MADAKPSFKAKLALVDENFVVPADFAKRPIEEQRELRDTSLLANGIKEGKRRALAEKLAEAHATELTRLNETHAHAAKRAFGHGFWRGGTIVGLVTAGVFVTIMAVYSQYVINTTFDASRDMQTQSAITGQIAAERAQRP